MDDETSPLLIVGGRRYRATVYVIIGAAVLVFGGIWGLVAWDHFTSPAPPPLRFVVVTIVCVAFVLAAVVFSTWANRRARRQNDFDTVVRSDDHATVLAHSFTGKRVEIAAADADGWVITHEAERKHRQTTEPYSLVYRLRLRLRDGRTLRSEPVIFPDRLRRALRRAGIEWDEESL